MNITRTSVYSGITRTLDIPVTPEQLKRWLCVGVVIQDAMPQLSPAEREFILTGITSEEWAIFFDPEEN